MAQLEEESDAELKSSTQIWYPFKKEYRDSWGSEHAFREVFQNWRDAMINDFDLQPHEIAIEMEEKTSGKLKDRVSIEVSAVPASSVGRVKPSSVACNGQEPPTQDAQSSPNGIYKVKKRYGFIRFVPTSPEAGWVELVNFRFTCTVDKLLRFGESNKGKRHDLAGQHGEGYKMAMLIFARDNLEAKTWVYPYSLKWAWSKAKESFFVSKRKVASAEQFSIRDLVATNLAEDFVIRIGRSCAGDYRNIPLADFRQWMKLVLDLTPASNTLSVSSIRGGKILFDEGFAGRIYCKGLYVYGGTNPVQVSHGGESQQDQGFRYGYNLHQGKPSCDRAGFTSEGVRGVIRQHPQYAHIANLWVQAVEKQLDSPHMEMPYVEALSKLYELLNDMDPRGEPWEDVRAMLDAMSEKVVTGLLKHARGPDETSFPFNCTNEKLAQKSKHIIEYHLKRTPRRVSTLLWKMFRKFNLQCRDPEEECEFQFKRCETFTNDMLHKDSFSSDIARSIRTAMEVLDLLSTASGHDVAPTKNIEDDSRGRDLYNGAESDEMSERSSINMDVDTIEHADVTEQAEKRNTQVYFVAAAELELDCLYDQDKSRLLIHGKWLQYSHARDILGVPPSEDSSPTEDISPIVYDFVVKELFTMALSQVKGDRDSEQQRNIRSTFEDVLFNRPRNVRVSPGGSARSLQVVWDFFGSRDVEYRILRNSEVEPMIVTLHDESVCRHRKHELLYREKGGFTATCDCTRVEVPLSEKKAIVSNLDPGRKYFALVARKSSISAYGKPPPAMAPLTYPKTSELVTSALPLVNGISRRVSLTDFGDHDSDGTEDNDYDEHGFAIDTVEAEANDQTTSLGTPSQAMTVAMPPPPTRLRGKLGRSAAGMPRHSTGLPDQVEDTVSAAKPPAYTLQHDMPMVEALNWMFGELQIAIIPPSSDALRFIRIANPHGVLVTKHKSSVSRAVQMPLPLNTDFGPFTRGRTHISETPQPTLGPHVGNHVRKRPDMEDGALDDAEAMAKRARTDRDRSITTTKSIISRATAA